MKSKIQNMTQIVLMGILVSLGPCFGSEPVTDTQATSPSICHLTQNELKTLAVHLAPKVDLFSAVWSIDPKAEFYAGTTRDFLYWILGHFNKITDCDEKEQKIVALKERPFIKISEILAGESDADILANQRELFSSLNAEDFGIRKLDILSFESLTPGNKKFEDERNQGFIPIEKMRLSSKGLSQNSFFGNGVNDIVSGQLSIQFPDPDEFWKTQYAIEGSNHPVLLAIRYLRILAQDYRRRIGNEIPVERLLLSPATPEIQKKITSLVEAAPRDPHFALFLKNAHGRKWINGSIQKSFRSFTNANAAFVLMKKFGVLDLIQAFPEELEPIHQYLLKRKNIPNSRLDFLEFGLTPEDVLLDINDLLTDRELFHGTRSEAAFRSIISQGVIPSDDGNAGRGFYGVSKRDLSFAIQWANAHAKNKNLVVAIQLKPSTRMVDISQGPGAELFNRWTAKQLAKSEKPSSASIDAFAEAFGIDLLRYYYSRGDNSSVEAFVLKNADCIESRRGVFKNPRSVPELLSDIDKINDRNIYKIFKNIYDTSLSRSERLRVLSQIDRKYLSHIVEPAPWKKMKAQLKDESMTFVRDILFFNDRFLDPMLWNIIVRTLLDQDRLFNSTLDILAPLVSWPMTFWQLLPSILQNLKSESQKSLVNLIRKRTDWPPFFMREALRFSASSNARSIKIGLGLLKNQKSLPKIVWNKIYELLRSRKDREIRELCFDILLSQHRWSNTIWKINHQEYLSWNHADQLHFLVGALYQKNWPSWFEDRVSKILDCPYLEAIGDHLSDILKKRPVWPRSIWEKLPAMLKEFYGEQHWFTIRILTSRTRWPKYFSKQLAELILGSDSLNPYSIYSIAMVLKFNPSWDQAIWDKMPVFLSKIPNKDFLVILEGLRIQESWSIGVWESLWNRYKSGVEELKIPILHTMRLQTDIPKDIYDKIREHSGEYSVPALVSKPSLKKDCGNSLKKLQKNNPEET